VKNCAPWPRASRIQKRIDLTVGGKLTLIKSDGALWYLVVCSDLRIMCITYQGNGMRWVIRSS